MKTESITGRDSYIIGKALAYGIETIEALPDKWQEWSDKEDMIKLLDALAGPGASELRIIARSHIERRGMKVANGQLDVADRPAGKGQSTDRAYD